MHFGRVSTSPAVHEPLAQLAALVQKAPLGARQLPPVQAVPSGQSVLLEHVWQTLFLQK